MTFEILVVFHRQRERVDSSALQSETRSGRVAIGSDETPLLALLRS